MSPMWARFLAAASALVKPGGRMVLSTINRTPKARALAIVGAERILQWAPEGAHDYDKLVTPEEIRAGAPGLEWDEPVGITYNPLGKGWALSRDTDVNYHHRWTETRRDSITRVTRSSRV